MRAPRVTLWAQKGGEEEREEKQPRYPRCFQVKAV